jgi:hypothetical protein
MRLPVLFAFLVSSFAVGANATPEPTCVTSGTTTACGYGCETAYGTAACAQAPGGMCKAANGKIACGFSCEASAGEVACAQTPFGVCIARTGQVRCFDPPGTPPFGLDPKSVQKAQCVVVGTSIACGYHCARTASGTTCAQTPNGACIVNAGRVTCVDPPPAIGLDPRQPAMQCLRAGTAAGCGYGCISNAGAVHCARTPAGKCQIVRGEAVCFDPPS